MPIDPPDQRAFGRKLRYLRGWRGFTLSQFAAELDMPRSSLFRLESGATERISPALLARMVRVLDVPADALVSNLETDADDHPPPAAIRTVLETRYGESFDVVLVEIARGRAKRWEVMTIGTGIGTVGAWEHFSSLPAARIFLEQLTSGQG